MFSRLLRQERKVPPGRGPRTLIIAPTRELAIQIKDEADLLGRHCGMKIHAVYGGVDYVKQLDGIKAGVDVLIGTPGRLIDYFKQKAYHLDGLEVLVIDEADRMFDMGFIDDIRFLARRMSSADERQSYLYSATLSQRVLELAFEYMNEVERIAVSEEKVTADNITQIVYHVGVEEKLSALLGLLEREEPSRALVFVNTRGAASMIAERLCDHGHKAGALAGDIDQRKRMRLLSGFKDGEFTIMVATDVASRGLHIEQVSHVFNYDLPQDPEDYVHRIGRTARAGASGMAVSLACERYVYSLDAIEEFIESKIPHDFPEPELLAIKPKPWSGRHKRRQPPGDRGGGRPGERRSGGRGQGPRRSSSGSGPARGGERSESAGQSAQGGQGGQGAKGAQSAKQADASPGPASDDKPAGKKRRRRRRGGKKTEPSTAAPE
jgi:ATP-dependent RNA helicase RhlB